MPCQGCRRLRASSRHFFHISRSGIGFLQSGLAQPLRKSGGSGDWDPALEHSVLQFFPINRLMLQALLSFKGMFCHLAKASSSTFSVLFFNEKTDSALWLDKKKIYIFDLIRSLLAKKILPEKGRPCICVGLTVRQTEELRGMSVKPHFRNESVGSLNAAGKHSRRLKAKTKGFCKVRNYNVT